MNNIFKLFVVFSITIVLIISGFLIGSYYTNKLTSNDKNVKFLSGFAELAPSETQTPTVTLPSPTPVVPTSTSTPIPPTPTPIEYKVTLISIPTEITEGTLASFTWTVDGLPKVIHKSAVYLGTASTQGILSKDFTPADSKYTESVKDFLTGDFLIPIRFIGNTPIIKPGKYYARAYALADSINYWSEEREFIVKPLPGYQISLIYYPQKVKLNENSAFTWEITGPPTITNFTAIVGAKESKSGKLEDTIDLSKTPYKVLVKDFTNGVYTVPLRYIGNATLQEYGTYYFRVLVYISGKYIWSDEYTLTVY